MSPDDDRPPPSLRNGFPLTFWERFESFDGRVDVGGLRVIVVIDASDFGYEFEAMLDRFEVVHGLANLRGLGAGYALRPYGALCVRGRPGPLGPYLPSPPFG